MDKYFDDRKGSSPDPGWDIPYVEYHSKTNYYGVTECEEPKLLAACGKVMMSALSAVSAEDEQEYKKYKETMLESLTIVRGFAAKYGLDGLEKGYPEMQPVWDKLRAEAAQNFANWVKENVW